MDYRDRGVVLLCGVLTFAGLAISPGNGQTLKKRGGILTPQLQRIYDSADFKTAYQVAETTYNASTPHPFRPYLWDQKKPLSWIGYKQNEFGRYTLDFEVLEDQLDAVCNDSQVTNNPEKVAQISQIQDRLTEDSLKALNAMVTAVDLRTLFISNNKKELADLWIPWRLPEHKELLDESKMKDILNFTSNVIKCLYESRDFPVQYVRSSRFSADVPRGR